MKKQNEYLVYVLEDVLGHTHGITHRAMFGGYGIYKNGIIFAIIAEDQLYFKVGESNIKDYQEKSSHPFVYKRKGKKSTTMSYWLVPEEIMNDKDEIKKWVNRSVKVSRDKK